MNNKIKSGVSLLSLAVVLTSCSITRPLTATSNPVGPKTGRSKSATVLGLIVVKSDGSVTTAAKNGHISKISTIDVRSSNYLFLYQTYETIVTGE